ncbi:MAG: O-antigen ligase family protein [Acidobacteria bacterium]|jgi:hypothetical protein|nr:O-antigen ligase family protein [Acidobacteriota bacterium]
MSSNKTGSQDYKTLASPAKNNNAASSSSSSAATQKTLRPSAKKNGRKETSAPENLINPKSISLNLENREEAVSEIKEKARTENLFPAMAEQEHRATQPGATYGELLKEKKLKKKDWKDSKLLKRENWFVQNNHGLTYVGIFLFTLVVYFRPYELIGALSGFRSMALVFAVATLLIYLPSQIMIEGSLLVLTTEVKCLLFIAFWALLTTPVAIDPSMAWATFNDIFSKVLLIFIVMVNTVRTRARLKGLMWLAIAAGVMISWEALSLYQQGIFKTEGYRVNIDSGGMFGNANDMALHLIIFLPVAVTLGLAAKNKLVQLLYFAIAALMIGGVVVTQSRSGFLGLLTVGAVLVWKLGKKQRLKSILISAVVSLIFIALAPGNYGLRIISIFIPSLDPVGSASARSELLQLSILVTLRHPLGIGMGNFPIVSIHNLETHNAYTQVSSELGWLAAAAYVLLIVSPVRKLAVIERRLFASVKEDSWIYYMSVGVQASIIGYMVSSFFAPVAYNWYVYYPIAYAVCLRRIYQDKQAAKGIEPERESRLGDYFQLSKA